MSGREDWRRRVAFFAFFGALGWGFGGSISYMQIISYTHSGHLPSQLYGFAGLFLIGALWAGLGGAGTALPAVMPRERLTALFRPLLWVFGVWWVWTVIGEPWFETLSNVEDSTWRRHESALYWFDADWTKAVAALVAVLLFDLWDRRQDKFATLANMAIGMGIAAIMHVVFAIAGLGLHIPWVAVYAGLAMVAMMVADLIRGYSGSTVALALMAAVGAAAGWFVQRVSNGLGLSDAIARTLNGVFDAVGLRGPFVRYQGDIELFRRAEAVGMADPSFTELQRALLSKYDGNLEQFQSDLYTNWPAFYFDYNFPLHLGWVLGSIMGVAVYFAIFGRFGSESRLLLYMALGWIAGFIVLPVLLGLRMTPPRSDDWAGILGVYVATLIYLLRYQLAPVAYASIVSAIVGGIGFSGAACLKLIMVRPGNPKAPGVTDDAAAAWSHWQNANWHSFLEQSYGFINGIGIALAMGLLAPRVWAVRDDPRVRRWTETFSVAFVLLFLVYVNWRKAAAAWVEEGAVPELMRMFWFEDVEWGSVTWFSVVFGIVAATVTVLLIEHTRGPRIPIVPSSNLGKGQLLYLVFLWVCVLFNLEQAITGFSEERLITEAVIFVNAAVATVLLLLWARPHDREAIVPAHSAQAPYARALFAGVFVAFVTVAAETAIIRGLYGDHHAGHSGRNGQPQMRFGPDAEWRINPLLKSGEHN